MKKLSSIIVLVLLLLFSGAAADEQSFLITAPDGAPAVSIASLYEEMPDSIRIISADTIAAEFAKGESDFLIAPVNAGARLFNAGKSEYRLAAVVTWGNLVFASQIKQFTIDMINQSKIVLFGENTINASVALYVLQMNGINPSEIEYLATAKNTQELLLNDPEAIVLTAEPIITIAKMKNDSITSYSLNQYYEKVTGYEGYAQAGLFVNSRLIRENPEKIQEWIEMIQKSVERCNSDIEDVAQKSVALSILPNEKVAVLAIPGCGIKYCHSTEVKDQIIATANIDIEQFGGKVPSDDFYYDAR